MTPSQHYALLAGVLIVEAFAFALISSVALYAPGAGSLSFLLAAAVVFYYGARHATLFGVAAALFNTLLLAYFSQSQGLPTVLLLLIVVGAAPYIEQLAPRLARLAFMGAYAVTAVALSAFTRGNLAPTLFLLVWYFVAASVAGLLGSRYLVRPSPLDHNHG